MRRVAKPEGVSKVSRVGIDDGVSSFRRDRRVVAIIKTCVASEGRESGSGELSPCLGGEGGFDKTKIAKSVGS